ncbi:MAG: phosphate ABC transporter substrate-binding protein [Polyangiaceae bacterium]
MIDNSPVVFGRRLGALGVMAVLSLLGLACDKSKPPAPPSPATTSAAVEAVVGTVTASGSSALQPLVNAAKEKFEAKYKDVSVEVSAGGSNKGLADVASGAVQIGDSDIFAPDDLKSQLVDHKVAVVGFAAMANRGPFNESITALSLSALARIFTGTVTNWKQLGGQSQTIVVINRAPGSGVRSVFGHIVLGGDKFVESQTEDNSGALVAKLRQTVGSVSYLSTSFADPGLREFAIKTDAGVVMPTSENILAGAYPIWSYEHMYTRGEAKDAAKRFLDYMGSADFQEQILPSVKGFIPVTRMRLTREKD